MDPLTVRVDCERGRWAVELPEEGERVTCRTLEDATRVARRCAEDRKPCEMLVCDAYHRVLYRELVTRAPDGARAAMN